jgi:hypothetical protein
MLTSLAKLTRSSLASAVCASLVLAGGVSATASASTNTSAVEQAGAASVPGLLEPSDQRWSPEALEDILAPVALYPDEFIGHVLVASTNPQEVLDAGNWRSTNANLAGTALDAAAKKAGFTPPVRVLLQNPVVLDTMCSEFGWTQELGQAYVNDQAGVLDAIQRLRFQAREAGNLQTSDKMVVETVDEGDHEAILLLSPDPNVVNVPQYDPERVYQHAVDDDDDDGVSMTTTVVTAALAFGGGFLVAKLFDGDDDDWDDDDYYHPNYYGPPMPYYAHRPYYPAYAGYAPATVYAPPPGYAYGHGGGTVVNKTVNKTVNNYWGRYDDTTYRRNERRVVESPITKARKNRPELATLEREASRRPVRRAPAPEVERRRYDTVKKETAARAERRKAAKMQRPAGGGIEAPTAVQPVRPTVQPTARPTAKPGTRPKLEPASRPTTERAGQPTAGRAGRPRVERRVGAPAEPAAPAKRERTGGRARAKSAEPAQPRSRAGKTGDARRPAPSGENRTPRKTGASGTGARRSGPQAGTTAEPSAPKAGRNSGTVKPKPRATGGANKTGGGRRGGAKGGRAQGAEAPPNP